MTTDSVSQQVADQLMSLIARDLRPGDRLPSENQLARQLEVSRPSVREALSALQALGIVESRKGQGTFVRSVGLESAIRRDLAGLLLLESDWREVQVTPILQDGTRGYVAAVAMQSGCAASLNTTHEMDAADEFIYF